MTDNERNQVLKMIENGKITPEQGLHLMEVLGQGAGEGPGSEPQEASPLPGPNAEGETQSREAQSQKSFFETDERISEVKSAVRRLWQIPLWIGIVITVASASGMYAILHGPGMNFWFFFMILPLLLGVAIAAAAVGSRQARWIFVNIQQKPGEKPARIFLGFPLPLRLAAWFLRIFGKWIPALEKTKVEDVLQGMEAGFTGDSPLIVHVDEGQDGERVQVYIG